MKNISLESQENFLPGGEIFVVNQLLGEKLGSPETEVATNSPSLSHTRVNFAQPSRAGICIKMLAINCRVIICLLAFMFAVSCRVSPMNAKLATHQVLALRSATTGLARVVRIYAFARQPIRLHVLIRVRLDEI